jgi:hypothetical protein
MLLLLWLDSQKDASACRTAYWQAPDVPAHETIGSRIASGIADW